MRVTIYFSFKKKKKKKIKVNTVEHQVNNALYNAILRITFGCYFVMACI